MKNLNTLVLIILLLLLFACDSDPSPAPNSEEPVSTETETDETITDADMWVKGNVFEDIVGLDGYQSNGINEPGLEGFEVCLDNNDNCDESDENGHYEILVESGGSHTISIQLPDGWASTTQQSVDFEIDNDQPDTVVYFGIVEVNLNIPYPMQSGESFVADCDNILDYGYLLASGETYTFSDSENLLFSYSTDSEEVIQTNVEGISLSLENGDIGMFQFERGNPGIGFYYLSLARCNDYLYTKTGTEPFDLVDPTWDPTIFGWYWIKTHVVESANCNNRNAEDGLAEFEAFFNNGDTYIIPHTYGIRYYNNDANNALSSLPSEQKVVFEFENSSYALEVASCNGLLYPDVVYSATGPQANSFGQRPS